MVPVAVGNIHLAAAAEFQAEGLLDTVPWSLPEVRTT